MARYSDELADMHPRSWLSKYRKTNLLYLLKMGIFYIALGSALEAATSSVVPYLIDGYHEPNISIPIILGAFAGPSEETLFYGIPFYLSGNLYVVLATGIVWSALHILNTTVFQFKDLAYGNYMFTIPWIFFTLRVWISGKGWFSIIFHSAYDVIALSGSCALGQNTCSFAEGPFASITVLADGISSAILLVITYALYRRKKKRLEQSIKNSSDTTVSLQTSISRPKRPTIISALAISFLFVPAILTVLNTFFQPKSLFDIFADVVIFQIIIGAALLSGKGGRMVIIILAVIDSLAVLAVSMFPFIKGTPPVISIGLDVVVILAMFKKDVSNYFKQLQTSTFKSKKEEKALIIFAIGGVVVALVGSAHYDPNIPHDYSTPIFETYLVNCNENCAEQTNTLQKDTQGYFIYVATRDRVDTIGIIHLTLQGSKAKILSDNMQSWSYSQPIQQEIDGGNTTTTFHKVHLMPDDGVDSFSIRLDQDAANNLMMSEPVLGKIYFLSPTQLNFQRSGDLFVLVQ